MNLFPQFKSPHGGNPGFSQLKSFTNLSYGKRTLLGFLIILEAPLTRTRVTPEQGFAHAICDEFTLHFLMPSVPVSPLAS